ncbi:DUF427 domain-containing protein [Kitasatospora sp. NBC_01560]|uniref:DUF427 domain-containing protein n=1 Tax=Kitasatospora sp. NBC_01560 TaxID=2975965 RepID=UPI0038677DD2
MTTEPDRGGESVWDYPRPPRIDAADGRLVQVLFAGRQVASTRRALRVLETSHPPVWYVPPEDVATELLHPAAGESHCEWKGSAHYWDLRVGGLRSERAAWSYPRPEPAFRQLRGHFAFYPARVDRCTVDGETVRPQEGDFYGGWITSEIRGPFKGAPGTGGW